MVKQPKIPIWLTYEDWLTLTEILVARETILYLRDKDEAKSIGKILTAMFKQVAHYAKMMTYTSRTQRY